MAERARLGAGEEDARVVAIILAAPGATFCAAPCSICCAASPRARVTAQMPGRAANTIRRCKMAIRFRRAYTYLMSIRNTPAVEQYVAGMGEIAIVACCDLRFASDQASFMTAFARRGLIAEWAAASDPAAVDRSGPCTRSAVLVAQDRRRGSGAAWASSTGSSRTASCCAFTRRYVADRLPLLSHVDGDHEAPGRSPGSARPPARRSVILESFRRPRLPRGGGLVPEEAPAVLHRSNKTGPRASVL